MILTPQEMLNRAILALKKHEGECDYCNQLPSADESIIGEIHEFDDCPVRHDLMRDCEIYDEEFKI